LNPTDLTIETFLALRETFFSQDGSPKPFRLREKRNTQDDPLDEHIAVVLSKGLRSSRCQKAPGPLISPDLVVYRPEMCDGVRKELLREDPARIVAIEVKKLERTRSGQVARSTGLDYNTTPPCGTVRVYDVDDNPIEIRGFYLFACQERARNGRVLVSALTLCDGNALNADFDLYLKITGQRQKGLGLGTYGDGVNRNRPMLIFSNPLGAAQLDHAATLITPENLSSPDVRVSVAYQIGRTLPEGGRGVFAVRKLAADIPRDWETQLLVDPFPKPVSRVSTTQQRGRFRVPIRPDCAGQDR